MNVYETIAKNLEFQVLKNVEITTAPGVFSIKPHQVLPTRYLTAFPDERVLCLDYEMGTGKTVSACYAIVNLIETLRRIYDLAGTEVVVPKIYILGSWVTLLAFEKELLMPELGLVTQEEVDEIKDDLDRKRLLSKIYKYVEMITYQKFFNRFFVGVTALVDKSDREIVKAIEDGRVTVNKTMIDSLSNSLLVIDEYQNLYSSAGTNTYGSAIEYILQHPDIHGLRMMALSGTFITTSSIEMIPFVNTIRPKGSKRFNVEELTYRKSVTSNHSIVIIKEEAIEQLLKVLDGKVAYYKQPILPSYPEMRYIGSLFARNNIRFKRERIVECQSSEEQWNAYLAAKTDEVVVEGEDVSDRLLASDFHVPPNEPGLSVHPKYATVFRGEGLRIDKIRKYSAIGYEYIKLVLDGAKNHEKSAAYHRRIHRFGILQYEEILRANGIIDLNSTPNDLTLCCVCSEPMHKHNRSTKHQFIPMRYMTLTGSVTEKARAKQLRQYNSAANSTGNQIMHVLLSSIGELGITLSDTNHLIILGSVPSIAKKKQLEKRAGRMESHKHTSKKYVNIYMLIYSPPKGNNLVSEPQIRHYMKELEYLETDKIWTQVRSRAVNCTFGDDKCKYVIKADKLERGMYDTFYKRLERDNSIDIIRYALRKIRPIWSLAAITKHIRSNASPVISWSMKYIDNVSILNAISTLYKDGEISIFQIKLVDKVHLSLEDIHSDETFISLKSKQDALLYSSLIQIGGNVGINRVIVSKTGLQRSSKDMYADFSKIKGQKNRFEYIDAMLSYPDFIDILKSDYMKKGQLFELFKSIDAIIYEGDDDRTSFAKNRLPSARPNPIGFMIGTSSHILDNGRWTKIEYPTERIHMKDEVGDYCGIFSNGSGIAPGRWQPRFRLRPKFVRQKDKRLQPQGMGCRSINPITLKRVYRHFLPANEIPSQKEMMCRDIRAELLLRQSKSSDRIIYIYRELPVS